MVYSRHAVGGRRTFEKYETGRALTLLHRPRETLFPIPLFQNLIIYRDRIQPFVFLEPHISKHFKNKSQRYYFSTM